MLQTFWCYTLLYWLLALVFVYPSDEIVSAGLTVEGLLGSWLGSEEMGFIQHHMHRTCATMITHSLLPIGYLLALKYFLPDESLWDYLSSSHLFTIFTWIAVVLPILVLCIVLFWRRNSWQHHPLKKNLALYAPANVTSHTSWVSVASNVDSEFRRIDKFTTKTNSISRVVATDIWMMYIRPYYVHLCHTRDAVLILESSLDTQLSLRSKTGSQFLNIRVNIVREGISPFKFRVNSEEYRDLELMLANPVVNAKNIVIHQTLSDKFLQVFTQTVENNPRTVVDQERDMCIGCMMERSNVKLERRCDSQFDSNPCVSCYCRPMWCLSCMGKWFASRQDEARPEVWLSSKAPCPTCRSRFCLLDVLLIHD